MNIVQNIDDRESIIKQQLSALRRELEEFRKHLTVVEEKITSTNTGSPKLSGAVCRWCYGHKDMCEKCVFGSEFSPAAQHRAGA